MGKCLSVFRSSEKPTIYHDRIMYLQTATTTGLPLAIHEKFPRTLERTMAIRRSFGLPIENDDGSPITVSTRHRRTSFMSSSEFLHIELKKDIMIHTLEQQASVVR